MLVKDGLEAGMSINSLMHKYRGQLVRRMNAEIFSDSFPMKFYFADGELAFCSADAKKIGVKTGDCTLIEIKHKVI